MNLGPTEREIATAFTYHPPTGPDQVAEYEQIRSAARDFANVLADLVPPSRELSTAIAKVREAVMWANAGIACHPRTEAEPGT